MPPLPGYQKKQESTSKSIMSWHQESRGRNSPLFTPSKRSKGSRNRTFHYSSAGVAVGFLAHRSGWNRQESQMQIALADIFFTNSKQQENNANYVFFSLIP